MSPPAGLAEGLHADIAEERYHGRELGVASKSALDLVRRSPAHYYAWVRGEIDDEDSPALAFGRAFHTALLEPEKYARRYIVEPDFGDCRFKENKARRDEWRREAAGRVPVDASDARRIERMVEAVRRHPRARNLIAGGQPEVTVKWIDEATSLTCKGRVDYYRPDLRLIVDAKTALDASPGAFRKSCASYGYGRQEAMYRAGFAAIGKPVEHFVFLAVEKEPPYQVGLYNLTPESVARGHESIRRDMETLAECIRTNRWPGYSEEIVELELPPWAA